MNIDARVVKRLRRLVVSFFYGLRDVIQTDSGARPQLAHYQQCIEKLSLVIRFAAFLGLIKEDKLLMDAVQMTYAFVSSKYMPGDQVTLIVDTSVDRNLVGAEMLAHHLHDGARPGDLSRVQSKDGRGVPPRRIPIHCVACWSVDKSSISEWNNELKSRFPTGIEHVICWDYGDGVRSCATRYDADGSMISREICISGDSYYGELRRHCTKHVIYYREEGVPKWDGHEPVWTHIIDSSPSNVQAGLPLEATMPFGMYVHELRKYQGLPGRDGDVSMLVWKSYRSADKLA